MRALPIGASRLRLRLDLTNCGQWHGSPATLNLINKPPTDIFLCITYGRHAEMCSCDGSAACRFVEIDWCEAG